MDFDSSADRRLTTGGCRFANEHDVHCGAYQVESECNAGRHHRLRAFPAAFGRGGIMNQNLDLRGDVGSSHIKRGRSVAHQVELGTLGLGTLGLGTLAVLSS